MNSEFIVQGQGYNNSIPPQKYSHENNRLHSIYEVTRTSILYCLLYATNDKLGNCKDV